MSCHGLAVARWRPLSRPIVLSTPFTVAPSSIGLPYYYHATQRVCLPPLSVHDDQQSRQALARGARTEGWWVERLMMIMSSAVRLCCWPGSHSSPKRRAVACPPNYLGTREKRDGASRGGRRDQASDHHHHHRQRRQYHHHHHHTILWRQDTSPPGDLRVSGKTSPLDRCLICP